jgi:hypothetical protein
VDVPAELKELSATLSSIEAVVDVAALRRELAPAAWRQWRLPLPPGLQGRRTLEVRATDGRGRLQTPREAPPHPSGASGYDQVDVVST